MTATTDRTVTLVIPVVCPSVNTLLSGKLKDRIRAKNAVKWQAMKAWNEAGQPVFAGPVAMDVHIYWPDLRERDWVNAMSGGVKVACDLLVEVGCIVGDSDRVLDMAKPVIGLDRDRPRVELHIRERGEA
jgi:hypothetical protein